MEEKKFKPTVEWMEENYKKLNIELFNGELGPCNLSPFTQGKGMMGGTLGWFKITREGVKVSRYTREMFLETYYGKQYINKWNFYESCLPTILLNANYSWSENAMLATLAHEMCHYYTYMNGKAPKQGHGKEFYAIGEKVSSRSNGRFTIQRLASAEQMSEMELDADIKAKNDKRIANKKSKTYAIFVFGSTKTVELTTTTSEKVMKEIFSEVSKGNRWNERVRGKVEKVIYSNDQELIEMLYSKGYRHNMRSYRFWNVGDKPWISTLDQYVFTEFDMKAEDDKNKELIQLGEQIVNLRYDGNNYQEVDYSNITTNEGTVKINGVDYHLKVEKNAFSAEYIVYFIDFDDKSIKFDDYQCGVKNFYEKLIGYEDDFSEKDYKKTGEIISKFAKTLGAPKPKLDPNVIPLFRLKLTSNNTFEVSNVTKEELYTKLKERFPKMSEENIEKLMNNPSNYPTNENISVSKIVENVVNKFLVNEGLIEGDDFVEIDPNMNLGIESPLENEETL